MSIEQQMAPNPLQKYFRQPKLYIRLPSGGEYYPEGALQKTENGEYPIFAMTARDELTFKTPDALLNGQATVDVIQSCVPNIKDAWSLPSIDLDAVLIAIRIASQGENLDIDVKVPGTDIEKSYTTDLQITLGSILNSEFDGFVNYQGMSIYLRPLSYREFTQTAIKTFEEQRIIAIVNNEKMNEEDKLRHFAAAFSKLTDLTVMTATKGVYRIDVDGQTVTNPEHIAEFIANADSGFFRAVVDHLEQQRDNFAIRSMTVESTEEEIEAGAPKTYEIPITLDASNFFASRS